jgi:serpin B
MRLLLTTLLCLVTVPTVAAIQTGVNPNSAQPAPAANPDQTTADQTDAVKGSNAFAVDLYGQMRTRPGNLFFSPESISTAFAMAYAGARGETATSMATVFHFTLPPDRLHPAMGALLAAMNSKHDGYELHLADALWAQQDTKFLESYLKLTQSNYGAGFHQVNFKASPEAVRGTINEWVEQQTNNKIQNLIQPGVLTAATKLVLTNAIYFKGDWLTPFDKSSTKDEDFHLDAAQTVKAPLMHRLGGYGYYDGGTFQALDIPYKADELSMVVLLPKNTAGLPPLEQSFTAATASDWLQKLEFAPRVILTLPRFTMTQQFELSGALEKMGMPQAFSAAADFSGMTGKPDFAISAAIHKAFVDVNETGTEAAAATSTVMMATAMRANQPEPPPIVFRADHPFLFLIRDTKTGGILFMGRIEDPTK